MQGRKRGAVTTPQEGLKKMIKEIVLPCLVGDFVYKICPKCNEQHNGTCEHCAWRYCCGPCTVGVRVYGDGSYNKHPLQIVRKRVSSSSLVEFLDYWNIMFFATEKAAKIALEEYDQIRNIQDRDARVAAYNEWEKRREIINPLRSPENV